METVINYLEKNKKSMVNQRDVLEQQLKDIEIQIKENTRFIQVLDESNDSNFEAFSPRSVNVYHKTKIKELQDEKKQLLSDYDTVKESILHNNEKINELENVLRAAYEAKRKIEQEY